MKKEISIEKALNIWANHSPELNEEHIPIETLIQYALPNGFKGASTYDIRHLSLCPRCLNNFFFLSETEDDFNSIENKEDDQFILDFGMLKAAASDMTNPVELRSDSRRFTLGIYPDEDNPNHALLILQTEENKFEGSLVCIKDARNRLIMNARIQLGKASQTTDHLDQFDLSTWSLSLTTGKEDL